MMIDFETEFLRIKKIAYQLTEKTYGKLVAELHMAGFDQQKELFEMFFKSGEASKQAEIELLKAQHVDVELSKSALDVVAERQRQISAENYKPDQDDAYTQNELTRAAEGYIHTVVSRGWTYESNPNDYECEEIPPFWPWADEHWKPKSPRRDLVRAAALIIAEIERIDRANERKDV